MKRKFSVGPSAVLLPGLLALVFLSLPAAPVRAQTAAGADPVTQIAGEAWSMARSGHLEDVWQQIRSLDAQTIPRVAELQQQLSLYSANQEKQNARVREDYDKAVAKMKEHLTAGKTADALTQAVSAQALADAPRDLLNDPVFTELLAKADAESQEHEKQGHWLRALTLYSRLDRLFDIDQRYHPALERVSRRVGYLRTYAPQVLMEMSRQQAREDGQDPPPPWNIEPDYWKKQLEGVKSEMLIESLDRASQNHVEKPGIKAMLLGGVEALEDLLHTGGLEGAFPLLASAEKSKAFLDFLQVTRDVLNKQQEPVTAAIAGEVVKFVLERNAETVKLPESLILYELGNGATGTLDDYSTVIWPHQKAQMERTTQGKFSGVGIQITLVNRQLTVVTPLDDTPAYRAHIRPGDRIVTIDGKSTQGIDLAQAVEKITGPENTQVELGIESPGAAEVRNVKLTRTSISIVSIKGWQRRPDRSWNYYIDETNRIGYVRLTTFGPQTADELDAALTRMSAGKGLNGLILDLRSNPGGTLKAAIDVPNRFLDRGVIVSTTSPLARPEMADPSHTYPKFPLVVLINEGSASASEIVAGALQVHNRALIVGENSFGKGSVQNLYPIGEGSAYLKLTTQYYRIPDGSIIHRRPKAEKWGIRPDVMVRMTARQVGELDRARMILDVLREGEGDGFDPRTLLNENEAAGTEGNPPPVTIKTADEILSRGLDPQLSTSLLLLKTQLLNRS